MSTVLPVSTEPSAAYLEKSNMVDKSFNDRLKQVYVTSVDKASFFCIFYSPTSLTNPSEFQNPNFDLPKERTMPKDRTTPFALTPHSQTTDKRAPNSLLVDDLKMILLNYKLNPEKWTHEYIAARFDISQEIAGKKNHSFIDFESLKSATIESMAFSLLEKLVTNYSTLETFYAKAPSESDKYLQREDPVEKINPQTSILEMEAIVADKRRKWKTKDEFLQEWKIKK